VKNVHVILVAFVTSWGLLVFNLASSPELVFDERIYVNASKDFIAGTPTSNPVHPPLAKYFIAIGIKTLGDNPWGWRIASTLFGALALSMMLAWVQELTGSVTAGITAAMILAFNNFWFVMSRVAMLPIFSFALSVVGLYFYTAGRNKNVAWLIASGAAFGFALGCRWSAIVAFGIPCLLACRHLKRLAYLAGSAGAAYAASFVPLIMREHDHMRSLIDMNVFMWHFHRYESISSGSPFHAQPWYQWVFRTQPEVTLDYLVANPVVTFLGLAAIAVALYYKDYVPVALCLGSLALWAASLRPCMYYYYYLEALSFSAPVIAIACWRLNQSKRLAFRPEIAVIGLTFAGFLFRYGAMTSLPSSWDFTLFYQR
jgi:dolichyl-phosphate-mannose-protein mannosyltransferase